MAVVRLLLAVALALASHGCTSTIDEPGGDSASDEPAGDSAGPVDDEVTTISDTTAPTDVADLAEPNTLEVVEAAETAQCAPDCAGRDCGPDGCGGTCGSCSYYSECSDAGQCGEACHRDCFAQEFEICFDGWILSQYGAIAIPCHLWAGCPGPKKVRFCSEGCSSYRIDTLAGRAACTEDLVELGPALGAPCTSDDDCRWTSAVVDPEGTVTNVYRACAAGQCTDAPEPAVPDYSAQCTEAPSGADPASAECSAGVCLNTGSPGTCSLKCDHDDACPNGAVCRPVGTWKACILGEVPALPSGFEWGGA